MGHNDLREKLKQLSQGYEGRTKSGTVRAMRKEIEEARAAGVTIQKIAEVMRQNGFVVSKNTLRTALLKNKPEPALASETGPAAGTTETETETETPAQRRARIARAYATENAGNPFLKNTKGE